MDGDLRDGLEDGDGRVPQVPVPLPLLLRSRQRRRRFAATAAAVIAAAACWSSEDSYWRRATLSRQIPPATIPESISGSPILARLGSKIESMEQRAPARVHSKSCTTAAPRARTSGQSTHTPGLTPKFMFTRLSPNSFVYNKNLYNIVKAKQFGLLLDSRIIREMHKSLQIYSDKISKILLHCVKR